ncbi:MAG TPA: hypothetical protein VJA21_17880, partial [Verrucomicrobiae bacterium]
MTSVLRTHRLTSIHWFAQALRFSVILLAPGASHAGFSPIPLTAQSHNHDLVVERTAPAPLGLATTASVDGGLGNTGYSWFESGYNASWPATGLPAAGSSIVSELATDHEYGLAPDYRTNNGVLIDSVVTRAELTLASPVRLVGISFLLSGAHDGGWGAIACGIHHEDGTVETNSIRCYDWVDNTRPYAYTANGRVNVGMFSFANINGNLPKLYSADVSLTNNASLVTGVELWYVSGTGHSVVMAVSGAAAAPGPFSPLAVSGYNADV